VTDDDVVGCFDGGGGWWLVDWGLVD